MASLTHLLGIGGVTDASARYRARADGAATLKIEYSTSDDLSGSTTSTGVAVVSGDDFTGGEEITGLSANTAYYYRILVDDVAAHTAPFPSFRTFPTEGVDADVTVVWGSCQLDPSDSVFASIAAESPHVFLHLGDFGYPDSTVLSDQRTSYQAQYADDFLASIVRAFPRAHTWDDHDFGANNSDGDLANKANSLQAFKEYLPSYDLPNGSNGIWYSFTLANAEFWVLDTRYQREGSRPRFPDDVPGTTKTADTGSTGTSLVLRSADSPSAGNDAYNTWYAAITTSSGTYYRRVSDYVGASRTATLSASVPDLDDTSTYFLKRASMLDMNAITDGQTEWLISAMNASTAKWKFLVSSVIWNPTFNTVAGADTWGRWDADQIERKYIQQHIPDDVIVLSGDRHFAGIDDGINSELPEATASPFNNTNIAIGGTWSHGTYTAGKNYGVLAIGASSVTLTIKNAAGSAASGVTALTISQVEPPSAARIRWLRA